MRVLILIDEKNFEQGVFNIANRIKEFRFVDFYKLNNFMMNYLRKNLQYKDCSLTHLRTYFYTGEFTDKLIERIQSSLEKNNEKKEEIINLLEKCKKNQKIQEEFFKRAKSYYFFEVRSKPLQFSPSDIKIFQKGVDVQLAADLVDFTHKNVYDIAIILSGDIDLLESIKIAKGMGKQIIIVGDRSVTAEEMKEIADLYVDLGKLEKEDLNKLTHTPYNKEGDKIIC
jgi:uncharacterized LabA/DUF88 family protein